MIMNTPGIPQRTIEDVQAVLGYAHEAVEAKRAPCRRLHEVSAERERRRSPRALPALYSIMM